MKNCVLKTFTELTEKHLCWGLFFNKGLGWKPATLLKRVSGIGVF